MALHRVEEITQLEHVDDGGVERKRVGLFAKDLAGSGVLELSALSTATGVSLQTSAQVTLGNITVQATSGPFTIYPGPNQIGSVTVSNFPASQAVTFSGLISLASGTEIRSLATVLNFPATQAVSLNQLVSLPSGTQLGGITSLPSINASVGGTVAVSNSAFGVTGLVSLPSGTQLGGITSLPSINASIGGNVGITGLVSLPSGFQLGGITSLPSINASVGFSGLISLASGTEVRALVTIFPRTDYIGLMSVSGNVAVSNFPSQGMVTLFPGPNQIGSVTISNSPTLGAGANYVGLASVNVGGNLPAGTNYIGLASVNIGGTLPALTAGTAFVGLVSISGNVLFNQLVSLPSGFQLGGITSLPSVNTRTGLKLRGSDTEVRDDAFYGDNVQTDGVLMVHPRLWNGAGYDRTKGDTTNGMFVQIKSPFNSTSSSIRVSEIGTRQLAGSYRFGSSQMSGATGITSMFSIENPTGSGVNIYIKRMELQSVPLAVVSIPMVLRIGRVMLMPISGPSTFYQKSNTSASTGGRAIVRQYFPVASLATGAMWTGNFGMRMTDVGSWNPTPAVVFSEPRESDDVVLAPNEALLVQQDANLGGLQWRHSLDMSWDEGLGG